MTHLARVLVLACVATPAIVLGQSPTAVRFIVRRGTDTVATEEFTRSATVLSGTVASSSGVRTHYEAALRPDGSVQHLQATRNGREATSVTTLVDFSDTIAEMSVTVSEQTQKTKVVSGFRMVPYLDVSFALCEQIVRAAHLDVGQTAKFTAFRIGAVDTTTISVMRTHADSVTLGVGQRTIRLVLSASGDVVSATAAPNQPAQRPGALQSWIVERVPGR